MRRDLLSEFPAIESYLYLNTASIGLVPKRTIDAVTEFSRSVMRDGAAFLDEEREAEVFEDLRKESSKLLGCDRDEVAVFSSVTEALSSIALALGRGGKVVSTSVEFPSVVYPWMRIGKEKGWSVELVEAEENVVDEGRLLSRITEGVKVVCISHVEFLTGQKFDLRAIAERAHEIGALLIVDGIQAAGCVPLDVKKLDVDVYVAGSYKWLLGPMGAAFAYIRRELADDLEPGIVGWRSVEDMWSLSIEVRYAGAARKFEYGTSDYSSKVGLASSIEYILSMGVDAIYEHDMRVSSKFIEELSGLEGLRIVTPEESERRGPIVALEGRGLKRLLEHRGEGRKLVASMRRGLLRFSFHFYNDEDDASEVAEMIAGAIRAGK